MSSRGDGPVGQIIGAGIVVSGLLLLAQFGLALHADRLLTSVAQDAALHGARHRGRAAEARSMADRLVDRSAGSLVPRWRTEVVIESAGDDSLVPGAPIGRRRMVVRITGSVTGPLGSWPVEATGSASIEDFVPQPAR